MTTKRLFSEWSLVSPGSPDGNTAADSRPILEIVVSISH